MRLGTAYDIYTGDLKELDNELHLLYGISGLYRKPNVEAQLGFMGRNQYASDDADFGDSGFTQLRAGVARPFGNFVPGVYVRKPLGENYNAFSTGRSDLIWNSEIISDDRLLVVIISQGRRLKLPAFFTLLF